VSRTRGRHATETENGYLGRLVREIVDHKGTQSAWIKVVPKYQLPGAAWVADPITTENLEFLLTGLRVPDPVNDTRWAALAMDGTVLAATATKAEAEQFCRENVAAVRVAKLRSMEVDEASDTAKSVMDIFGVAFGKPMGAA
jgi:hypothetical protein